MSAWVEEICGAGVKDMAACSRRAISYGMGQMQFWRIAKGRSHILLHAHRPYKCLNFIQIELSDHDFLQNGDVINGCERSTVKFYSKRIPCSCLGTKYEEMKSQPKRGFCKGCHQYKDRSTLRVCAGCNRHQYCSRKCQIDDLPNHKAMCKHLQRSARNT